MEDATSKLSGAQKAITGPLFWSLVLRAVGTVVSFATGILLARVLEPEGLGVYGTVIATALALSVVAQAGMPTLALREVAVTTDRKDWALLRGVLFWFFRLMIVTSAATAGAYLVGLWAYGQLTDQALPKELFYAAPILPFLSLVTLIYAELRGFHRYVAGQSLDILIRPTLFLTFCGLAYLLSGHLTPAQALLLQIPAGAITLVAGFILLRRALPAELRGVRPARRPREWAKSAVPLAASDAFQQLNAVYGVLIVGALSAPSEAGFLRVALSAVVFIAIPLSVFNVILAPRLAQLHAAREISEIQSVLVGAAAVMSAFSFASLAALYWVGQPLLETFFGVAYRQAWAPLMLLTAAQAIISLFGVGWVLLSVSGGEGKLTRAFSVSTAIAIATAFLLVPSQGAVGAGWAAVLGAVVQNLLCWWFLRRSGLESSIFGLLGAGIGPTPLSALVHRSPGRALGTKVEAEPRPPADHDVI